MDQAFNFKNETLKNIGNMGKTLEKSGNFVGPENWELCDYLFLFIG